MALSEARATLGLMWDLLVTLIATAVFRFNAALICAAVSTTTFFSISCSTSEFGLKESRCFYNLPSGKTSYDVVATLWVTEEQADKGLAAQLYQEMTAWLAKSWPLQTAAWPGREIPPADQKALPPKFAFKSFAQCFPQAVQAD